MLIYPVLIEPVRTFILTAEHFNEQLMWLKELVLVLGKKTEHSVLKEL